MPSLIQRLNTSGFPALQDSDTLYLPQPNPPSGQPMQPLTPIADSTRATLMANVTGHRPGGGPAVALSAGTPLTVPAGATITVAANTVVGHPDGSTTTLNAPLTFALPGLLPATASSGIQNGTGPNAPIIPDFTVVTMTLPAGGSAVLTNDGSSVELPAGASVAIRSGKPQPFYYVDDFGARYSPDAANVDRPYPVEGARLRLQRRLLDLQLGAVLPRRRCSIAIHLSQNQQFEDAQRWFHYIFDPTDDSDGPTPERFWKVAPFQYTDVQTDRGDPRQPRAPKQTTRAARRDRRTASTTGRTHPFQPARGRAVSGQSAYMYKTVMAYLDNLIAWGDSLFRQDTIETINEATQLYVLAAEHPRAAAAGRAEEGIGAAADLRRPAQRQLDTFGNAMVDMEADIPFDLTAPPTATRRQRAARRSVPSIGQGAVLLRAAQRQAARATGTPSPTGCSRSATA